MTNPDELSGGKVKDLTSHEAALFLTRVTNVAPSVIYIFNQQTQSNEYTNRSLGETLGYSAQEIKNMGANMLPSLCHPDDLDAIVAHFGNIRTLKDGRTASVEYRMRHKNGNWVWLLSHDTVFDRAKDGTVLRHIGIASDITPQKEAEEKANAEKLKATSINDELRAFSYSMSHDLKSPSNTLHLLLNELQSNYGDTMGADALDLLDMSIETVNRMRQLLDDVLSYTSVIDREIQTEPVSLNALVANISQDLHALSQNAAFEILVSDLPDVIADPLQLRVMLQNLLENAVKFHPPNEVAKVKVYAANAPDINTCTVTVEDNGIGVHPSKHDQIFTIFKRLHTNADFSGSGLGLAICRRVAANHDTKITLVSELGHGAAFSVGLVKA